MKARLRWCSRHGTTFPTSGRGCPKCGNEHTRYKRGVQRSKGAQHNTKAWGKLSRSYRSEQPLCEDCLSEGRTTPATQVHHKINHLDRPDLFMEWDNLMALCQSCHSRRTARGE